MVSTLPGTYGELTGIVYVANTPPALLVADATHDVIRTLDPASPATTSVFQGTLDSPGSTAATLTSPGALAWVAGSGRYLVVDGAAARYFFNELGTIADVNVALAQPSGILAETTPSVTGSYTAVVSETGGDDILTLTTPMVGTPWVWTQGLRCGGSKGFGDGPCAGAQFNGPQGLAWSDPTTIFVADTQNNRVREVSFTLGVSTVAGSGVAGHTVDLRQTAEIDGPTAVFCRPNASGRDVFIVDANGTEIRRQSLP